MKNKEEKKELSSFQEANMRLRFMLENPYFGTENRDMAFVTQKLAEFTKQKNNKKDSKIFSKFSKLFGVIYKDDLKNKAVLNFWIDKEIKKTRIEKGVFVLSEVIDLKKHKGEECIVTHKLDGTITIECGGINIRVPGKMWKEYEEHEN